MKSREIVVGVCVVGLLLVLTRGAGLAQGPDERLEPQGELSVEAVVTSKFTYQGLLREGGAPVSGARDMVFQLYTDAACTTTTGGAIPMTDVPVDRGIFSVALSVSATSVSGHGLWLGIQVEGTPVGCQEILPVPYALSLRPGARIEGEQSSWDAVHVVNAATTGFSYGVYARSYSTSGRGVYGYASAIGGETTGVYGQSDSAEGAGVVARGHNAGADLILAGNAETTLGDDGRITSDPAYASSDIVLSSNDTIRFDLDLDGDGEDADFEIRDKDGTLVFNVDERGAVTSGGPGIAAFPRPAYDSGWVALAQASAVVRTHNLGGNADNYVVDLTC
ncbi:MAG: hypothetical protein MUF84_16800, partial [Anaerolineae bacterium]|nr:hypothetical protein [Anaerolineae bacterium]